jgi:hypothetical protein
LISAALKTPGMSRATIVITIAIFFIDYLRS